MIKIRGGPARHPFVLLLSVLIFGQAALLLLATVYLIFEIFAASPYSYASAVILAVMSAITTGWLSAIALGVLRCRPWVRGAAIVAQVLHIAVAVGCFQGVFARPGVGWLLLIPAIIVLVLLFTPPVVDTISRDARPSDSAG
ncbi:MAG: hypothetical protein ACRCSP_01750 [Rhodoglobus sp.]